MTREMKGLLLADRWAPVTSEMGFLELGAEQAAQAFATWHREVMTPRGITVEVLPVAGTLEQVLKTGPFNTVLREYTLEEARAAHVL
jgi:hypothetical protein